MLDAPLAEFRDMDEPCRLDADVDEDAEIRDVSHGAAHDGAGLDVRELHDGLSRQGRGQVFARIASGLFERVHDVAHGRQSGGEILGEFCRVGEGKLCAEDFEALLVREIGEREAQAFQQFFRKRVGFGVDGKASKVSSTVKMPPHWRVLRPVVRKAAPMTSPSAA